jgi:hypothetical protein
MIQYGLISKVDAACLEKTIDRLCSDFKDEHLHITEIGLFDCGTARGIREYVHSKKRGTCYTGIDNNKDKKIFPPVWMNFIEGNSNEVYNQLEDNSQHLIFVDGNHSFPAVVADFFCYAPKVRVGGYLVFHDTAKHIKPFMDYQRMGSVTDPDMFISVRKALKSIGILDTSKNPLMADGIFLEDWDLIYDEYDENDEAGGVCVFYKDPMTAVKKIF